MAQLSSPLLLSQTESTIACSPYPTQELRLTTSLTKLKLHHLLTMAPPFFRRFTRARKPASPSSDTAAPPLPRSSLSSSITCVGPHQPPPPSQLQLQPHPHPLPASQNQNQNQNQNQQTQQQTLTNNIWDANEAIRAFLTNHWPHHAAYIKVDCAIPVAELHALGRLPRAEGLRACGRLVRVPVIHEEVALSLWEFLVVREEGEEERNRVVMGGNGEGNGVRVRVEGGGGGGVKRGVMGAVGVVRELLQRGCRLWGRGEKPGKAVKVRCPFCSGNCYAYHQPADTTRPPPQKGRQQKGEEDFWQREVLPERRGPPGTRSEGRQWSLFASFRELFNE